MISQIEELASEAKDYANDFRGMIEWPQIFERKFAELLILKCAGLCDKAATESAEASQQLMALNELGPASVAAGAANQAEKLSHSIKKHFGIKQ
jgi:hypothetical protein